MRSGVLAFVLALLALLLAPGVAHASNAATEAAAFTACQAAADLFHEQNPTFPQYRCVYQGPSGAEQSQSCSTGWISSARYFETDGNNTAGQWNWCVPASCSGGSSAGSYGGDGPPSRNTDGAGCCASWTQTGSVSYGGNTWDEYSGLRTGSRCDELFSSSSPPPSSPPSSADNPPKMCDQGQVSCYVPQTNTACYTTESGEQVCTQLDDASNCASGATGSVCYGKNGAQPPPPNDPPIPKGQPADSTQSGSTTTGSTTTNFTVNNYSGTSPGDAGSQGGSAGDTSGGKDGGSQSNQQASGNSPGPNGDHGTDSNGKCPDGSVPTASGCSGSFTDNGCDTPPACFGDAVMCGSARELRAIRCAVQAASSSSTGQNIGNVADALAGAGVPADGGASGDPSTSGLVSSSDLGEDGFDASGLGFSRTCPANPAFDVLGHSYTLDLTPMCNFASLLGWFVLLVASLVGLRIVATGKA